MKVSFGNQIGKFWNIQDKPERVRVGGLRPSLKLGKVTLLSPHKNYFLLALGWNWKGCKRHTSNKLLSCQYLIENVYEETLKKFQKKRTRKMLSDEISSWLRLIQFNWCGEKAQFIEKFPSEKPSSDELLSSSLTAICILLKQFPYFLINLLSVGSNYMARTTNDFYN